MAEIKKYLDQAGLQQLVTQIKAEDVKAVNAAKAYADGLAGNYDAAGSAATAEANAKAYADGLAGNYDAAGAAATVDAKLTAEVTRATGKEGELQTAIEGVDAKAVKNAEDIAAINNGTTGILAQAKKYADDEDAKVEQLVSDVAGDVADLAEYVGTIPEGATATDIVGYVQEKTAGIATDAALSELQGAVNTLSGDVSTIKGDYLKGSDKTELSNAISAEETRAKGIEGGLETRLAAVEGDYLKGADKTALQGNIDLKADKTALEAEVERATGVEEGLQNQINLIMNNPETKDVIDSIAEFTAYVEEHGEIAEGFRTDIDKNKEDIAAEVKRAGEAESALSGRIDDLEAIDHEAYVAADTALKNELNGEIAKKADASVVSAMDTAYKAADEALSGRLDVVEAQLGDGENSVSDLIATAKQEAIDAAALDATSKANTAESNAKGHADSLNTAMNTRVEALEAIDHSHANQDELDLIVSGDKAKWDEAYAKRHEHGNKSVIDGITSEKVAAWDAAEQNAKDYADGLNGAMTTKVNGIDGRLTTVEGAVATKAEDADLDAAIERIAANEAAIAANASAIGSFVAITTGEVDALFA